MSDKQVISTSTSFLHSLLSPLSNLFGSGRANDNNNDDNNNHEQQQQQLIKYLFLGLASSGTAYVTYRYLSNYLSHKFTTTVSAPGKVLITGGYLVLDSQYSGLVLASSSRFYSHIESTCTHRASSYTKTPITVLATSVSPVASVVATTTKTTANGGKATTTTTTTTGVALGGGATFNKENSYGKLHGTRSFVIQLESPQFHYETRYVIKKLAPFSVMDQHSFEIKIERAPNAPENKYIEYSLLFAMAVAQYFSSAKLYTTESLKVKLLADNDFYSQRQNLRNLGQQVNLETLKALPKFYSPKEKTEIHKTGLGSSAAMVTSLVGALLVHFGVVSPPSSSSDNTNDTTNSRDLEIIHRLSQFVHCLAQGKVGSGFDVSSATFGSQKYTRFNSRVLQRCLEMAERKNQHMIQCLVCDHELIELIAHDLELDALVRYGTLSKWDNKRTPFQLPPGFQLFVADVDQGSNTPSMIRQVLQWRSDKREKALEVWNQIDSLNNSIEQLFNELTTYSKEDFKLYMDTLNELSTIASQEWTTVYTQNRNSLCHRIADCMSRIRYTFGYIRQKLKYMGEQSSVPIEPDEQTELLNATMDMRGCLIAGVPGAGGFDAIFCILFGGHESEVQSRMAQMWLSYDKAVVCPLLLGESRAKGIVVETKQ